MYAYDGLQAELLNLVSVRSTQVGHKDDGGSTFDVRKMLASSARIENMHTLFNGILDGGKSGDDSLEENKSVPPLE